MEPIGGVHVLIAPQTFSGQETTYRDPERVEGFAAVAVDDNGFVRLGLQRDLLLLTPARARALGALLLHVGREAQERTAPRRGIADPERA